MPITATLLTSSFNNTPQSSYTTASITPSANKLEILTVFNDDGAGDQNTPTVTGCGLTWVQIATKKSTSQSFLTETMFRAMGPSPSTGSLTIDFAGQNQTAGILWSLTEFSGMDTSGTNGSGAIIQNATNDANTTQSGLTVTLAAFANSGNAVYNVTGWGAATAMTQKAGYTKLADTTGGAGEIGSEFLNSADTTPNWTWASSNNWSLGMAVEISLPITVGGIFRGSLQMMGIGN